MSNTYDFIVIGGGSAGYAAASTASSIGAKVAVVDGSETLGGLCMLRGCMPSKTLIYAAEVLHLAQKPKAFGLDIEVAKADMKAMQSRKRAFVKEWSDYRQEQLQAKKFELYQEQAQFIDGNTLALADGRRLKADKFLIATGSVVDWPNVPGLADCGALTSDDILNLDYQPESVIVLGGGVVACELAQFLSRIGSQVTQIQRSPHILKNLSTKAAEVVEGAFRDEGMELLCNTQIQAIEKTEKGVCIHFKYNGKIHKREATHLFNALGRKPNTDNLNLQAAGVKQRRSGHIETNDFQQSSIPHIYAAGDCAGPHEIVHVAIMQAECAAKHAIQNKTTAVSYEALTSVVFTDPQMAYVGITEEEMTARGIDFAAEEYPFNDTGKALLMEAHYGYVKVWADKANGKVIAAECVGKDASELIHPMAIAISLGANCQDLLKAHWYHPTLSEVWTYPIEELI